MRVDFERLREPDLRPLVSRLLLGACCCLLGAAVWIQSAPAVEEADRARADLYALARLVDEWRILPKSAPVSTADPAAAVAALADELKLKEKMTQLSARDGGAFVQFDRLYGEEFKGLLAGLVRRKLPLRGIEAKSLPSGSDRVLSVSLALGAPAR